MTSTHERRIAKDFLDELSALLDIYQSHVPTDKEFIDFFLHHRAQFDKPEHPMHYLYECLYRRREEDRLRVEILHLQIELAKLRNPK